MKNYAVILAGGVGKRMGSSLPKQFIKILGTPLIILTLKKILSVSEFDKVIIAIHSDWKDYLEKQICEYSISSEKIFIVDGGKERLDSIRNSLDFIKIDSCNQEDIVVICDAVRPFVTRKILIDSINFSRKHGATVCSIPATDTMIYVEDGKVIDVPQRSKIFHGQAPDSFRVNVLDKAINQLTEEEKLIITGTAQICVIKGIPVYTIDGDEKNIKITTVNDIELAENILMNGEC